MWLFRRGLMSGRSVLDAAGGVSYDAASLAIFAAFTTPPDDTRKGVIDACVTALKTAGVWAKMDLLYMLAAADSQAGMINWKSPGTFDLTQTGAGTWTTDQGWAGNGTTGFLGTGWDPATNAVQWAQNSAHIAAYGTASGNLFGTQGNNYLAAHLGVRVEVCAFASNFSISSGTSPFLLVGVRRDATNVLASVDGGSAAGGASNSAAATTEELSFSKVNTLFTNKQVKAGSVGAAFSDTELADYYSALHTYMVAIGADT